MSGSLIATNFKHKSSIVHILFPMLITSCTFNATRLGFVFHTQLSLEYFIIIIDVNFFFVEDILLGIHVEK